MRHRRLSTLVAALAVALSASACSSLDPAGEAAPPKPTTAAPEPVVEPTVPASDAGGACVYLDFAEINAATGEAFTVAKGGGSDEVVSCVLVTTAGALPDITFTKAPTAADTDTYLSEIAPDGADEVDDLGKSGYSAVRKKVKGGGPVVEIGWLTGGHMYSLRYTTAKGTEKDAAKATVEALVEVARAVAERASADEEKKKDED